jgi:HPt (histidine-containing phosphotransfer) domain-containing protein
MLYDLEALRKLSDNDENFILDMLQTFKRTAPPICERMQAYVAEKKHEPAGREAHKMIPGVSFLGAFHLKEILIRIEEMGKSGEGSDQLPELVSEAVNHTRELIQCFERDFPGKV